ncbi:fungal-specific transcription factor domain-containing protein [Trichoderma velutinum]
MEVRRMRISCRRCQVRKCTRVHPCGNCVGSDSECTFRDDDTRRRPVSRSYVVALEERLASYEAMLRNPQLRSPEWRQAMLSTAVEENPSASSSAQAIPTSPVFDYSGSSRLSTLTLQPGPQGSLSFYGPTSIYQKDCITARCVGSSQSPPNRRFELWQDFRLSRTLNVQEATINRSLSRFFRFLSAECLFIHHDTFLEDFFGQVHNNKYWSYPLLYSLSSLGARLGPGQGDLQDADSLARCSHEMASIGYLETPHTTVVQTLLALAFVELGNGHHVKGWMLSGMAFRMGQDIGLHQDPRFLIHDDSTITFTDDFSLRRRVYWGCYVADKMISLYLGRPMMLHEADAAVDPLDQLYRTESLDAELSIVPELDHFLPDVPDGKITLTVFIHQVELSKIIESVLSLLFSAKFIKTPRKELVIDRLARAEELSVRLYKWHSSLPESLAWSQWTPTKHSLSPQAAAIQYVYPASPSFFRPMKLTWLFTAARYTTAL